jgi:hypothetical protein
MLSGEFNRPLEEPGDDVFPRASWLRRLLERRSPRQLERTRQTDDYRLARRVQDIIACCGLSQAYYSIGGGRSVRVPHVVSVDAGPPIGLEIQALPGQTPGDFAAHASAFAYNLGVTEVRVIPLGSSLIRLELLPNSG